jgi:hypothetical protein
MQTAATPIGETDQVLIDELLMLDSAMGRNYQWAYDLIAPYLAARSSGWQRRRRRVALPGRPRGDPLISVTTPPIWSTCRRASAAGRTSPSSSST